MKQNIKRYTVSSLITFATGFLLIFATDIKNLDFQTLETAGWSGALFMIGRLLLKGAWEGFTVLLISIAGKLKK